MRQPRGRPTYIWGYDLWSVATNGERIDSLGRWYGDDMEKTDLLYEEKICKEWS